jgi:hypothetical protein
VLVYGAAIREAGWSMNNQECLTDLWITELALARFIEAERKRRRAA